MHIDAECQLMLADSGVDEMLLILVYCVLKQPKSLSDGFRQVSAVCADPTLQRKAGCRCWNDCRANLLGKSYFKGPMFVFTSPEVTTS